MNVCWCCTVCPVKDGKRTTAASAGHAIDAQLQSVLSPAQHGCLESACRHVAQLQTIHLLANWAHSMMHCACVLQAANTQITSQPSAKALDVITEMKARSTSPGRHSPPASPEAMSVINEMMSRANSGTLPVAYGGWASYVECIELLSASNSSSGLSASCPVAVLWVVIQVSVVGALGLCTSLSMAAPLFAIRGSCAEVGGGMWHRYTGGRRYVSPPCISVNGVSHIGVQEGMTYQPSPGVVGSRMWSMEQQPILHLHLVITPSNMCMFD